MSAKEKSPAYDDEPPEKRVPPLFRGLFIMPRED